MPPKESSRTNLGLALGVALIGLGAYWFYKTRGKGEKKAGDAITSTIKFKHTGPGGLFWIGYAIAPGHQNPATIPSNQWFGKMQLVGRDDKGKWYEIKQVGKMPDLTAGIKYDGFRTICIDDPTVVGWSRAILAPGKTDDWDSEVYKVV